VTIRTATTADLDGLVTMGRHFIEQTPYATRIAHNPTQMRALAVHLMTSPDGAVFVAERDMRLVGMIGVFVFPHPISAERIGSEVMWWMEPDARGAGVRLLRAAERWVRTQGVARFQMIAPTPDVEAIYQRLGFEKVETVYQRAVA
jgi:GNAT superfamily N-acetyltransferase